MTATKSATSGRTVAADKTATVFIDGEAGTTGLEIRERLANLAAIEVKSIDPALRKDKSARQDLMRAVDLIVLCLPDDAARDAVALADELGTDAPKIIDASTAHRVSPGWIYGFAEMAADQAEKIRHATRVANPGCYPTGGIALIRPLVEAGIMPKDYPVTVNAVSGYSGGGRTMIEAYEAGKAPAFDLYGLALEHKHIPELQTYTGLSRRPIFVPSVGNFRKGMLVSVPLHLDTLNGAPTVADIEAVLTKYYDGAELVRVVAANKSPLSRLEAEALNDTDQLEVFVAGKPEHAQAVLIARLDNLGKGAAGAAVQNIQLMLGLA